MYDGTPSTAGVEPTQRAISTFFTLTLFLCLAFWKLYQYMILGINANFVKRVDNDVTDSAEVLPTQNQRRTRGNYRKIAARFSDTQTTAKQRSVLLTNVRNGDVNEEEYFHAVNSTFKKPLRCARSCDQLKFTKFDPDCSWQASTKTVATTSPTPVYKRKSKATTHPFRDNTVSLSDEEFMELCNAISKIGYVYVSKKSSNKRPRSRVLNNVGLSRQSNFTMLFLSVLLPVAPFLLPGACILSSVVFSLFVLLRVITLTTAVLQKFLQVTERFSIFSA